MAKPWITVIVPAYNAVTTIDGCLSALLQQTQPLDTYEIVVVVDGPDDGTEEQAQRYGAHVLVQPHRGPAAARNAGAACARGDVLLFLDADCEPKEDWIEQMVRPFQDPGIVGVKGVFKTRQRSLVARFAQAEYEEKEDRMCRGQYIDFIDTGSAGYRADVFRENGGFNTDLPGAEDVEFSFRLAAQGYKMVLAKQAVVYHRHPESLAEYLGRKFRYGVWRSFVYYRFPSKMMRDSRTPQAMKVQLGLIFLLAIICLASVLRPFLVTGAVVIVGLFTLSTFPFCLKVARKDPVVAIVSPIMLLLRAVASLAGLAVGIGWTLLVPCYERFHRAIAWARHPCSRGEDATFQS